MRLCKAILSAFSHTRATIAVQELSIAPAKENISKIPTIFRHAMSTNTKASKNSCTELERLITSTDITGVSLNNETIQIKRKLLKDKLLSGKKAPISHNNQQISIPKCKLSAPRRCFTETENAYRTLFAGTEQEVYELSKLKGDNFIISAFNLVKRKMGMYDAPIKIKITNANENHFDASNATIYISRLKPQNPNGGEEEYINAIVHELNHLYQVKESYVNGILRKTPEIKGLNGQFEEWILNNSSFFENHTSSIAQKATEYANNFAHYITYDGSNYLQYRKQFVENQSHKYGEIVRDAYKSIVKNYSSSKQLNTLIDSLDALEIKAIQKISDNLANTSQETQNVLLEIAIEKIKNPMFKNYSVEQYVEWFMKNYTR